MDSESKLNMADEGMSPDKFLKAFAAYLVLSGMQSLPPRSREARIGFRRVVELLDEKIRELLASNIEISRLRPWIDTSNKLRLSPTGGVESWESALRSAQVTFTKVGNPDYELVSFIFDKTRAQYEIDQLSTPQRDFVCQASEIFVEQINDI